MVKGNLKAKICSLCFNTKCDIDFEIVEVIKEVLEIVLPKLNLEEGDKHLICTSCSMKLFAAFNFKSVCTDTEDTIFPYVNSQETPLVDLREIYLKKKGDIKSFVILENQRICRLCFQLVKCGFVSLNEVDADIIDNYIPEVNFNATKDPVMCKLCSDSLVTHGTFLSSCLAAQEENRKVCGDPAEDRQCCIKTEESKIEDDWESDPPPRLEKSSENIPVKKRYVTYTCSRCYYKTMYKGNLKRHCLKHISLTPTYISSKSQCESESRDTSSPCPLKDEVLMFQCEKCPYRTHVRQVFINHWLTHEVPSEVYECGKCHYSAIRKDHFLRHQLSHEDSAETIENPEGKLSSENIPVKKRKVTYTCNRCDFKTMYKFNLKRHCWKHNVAQIPTFIPESRDASSSGPLRNQAKMFQCEKCPFRTPIKDAFINHWWTHKVSSRKVYQCEKCHYRVTQKNHFRSHQLSHKNGGKGQIYTCDKCDFQTRYKSSLIKHQLRHKTKKWKNLKCYTGDDGQLMYKCNVCKYETKNRRQLWVHRCHEMSPTEQQKFKCHVCVYESDSKNKLTQHEAKHNSEVKPYKCKVCSFQTIWRPNFERHQLCHKKKCEVKTYDCFKCSFRTKYRDSLKIHMLRHSALE